MSVIKTVLSWEGYEVLILIILDGWGVNARQEGNAIALAKTPVYKSILNEFPHTILDASGESVGLPDGQMGNSEVGHLNIGAGRVVYQDLTMINKAIKDGEFHKNPVFLETFRTVKSSSGRLHLMGLLSDGGVHSHINHLYALLSMAKEEGLRDVFIHAFMDGRDTSPHSGAGYVKSLQDFISNSGIGKIATISGRYYAMDRDNRWDRVEKAYNALTAGEGLMASDPVSAIENSYADGVTDEFIMPTVLTDSKGSPVGTIKDNDGVLFFNFRADRSRELTRALMLSDFSQFNRKMVPSLSSFATMKLYDEKMPLPAAFHSVKLTNILGEVVSKAGLKQFRIAETEKYAHVTYFFNGGEEQSFPGEDRLLVPSPKDVATYDLKPEMSAYQVTEEIEKRIRSGEYSFILVNYANPDMVGHTGVLSAGIKAVEVIDECLGRVLSALNDVNGIACITSDHGDVEQMIEYETGKPHTAHTTNLVPFIVTKKGIQLRAGTGFFADIAPTVLDLMGIDKPADMTGRSLIIR